MSQRRVVLTDMSYSIDRPRESFRGRSSLDSGFVDVSLRLQASPEALRYLQLLMDLGGRIEDVKEMLESAGVDGGKRVAEQLKAVTINGDAGTSVVVGDDNELESLQPSLLAVDAAMGRRYIDLLMYEAGRAQLRYWVDKKMQPSPAWLMDERCGTPGLILKDRRTIRCFGDKGHIAPCCGTDGVRFWQWKAPSLVAPTVFVVDDPYVMMAKNQAAPPNPLDLDTMTGMYEQLLAGLKPGDNPPCGCASATRGRCVKPRGHDGNHANVIATDSAIPFVEWPQSRPFRKYCPSCGEALALRVNATTGQEFTGCSQYPVCSFTSREIRTPKSPKADVPAQKPAAYAKRRLEIDEEDD